MCYTKPSGFHYAGNPFSPAALLADDRGPVAPAVYLHHKEVHVRKGASLLTASQK